MSKNIIWILVIGFVLGFISREQWNTESWEFVFLAMQGIGSILVPVMIFWWANKDQRKKDDLEKLEKKKDKDKETIRAEIEKNLVPFTANKYEFKTEYEDEEDYKKERKKLLREFRLGFISLGCTIEYSLYSYMSEYIYLIYKFINKIEESEHLSIEELDSFCSIFSSYIIFIPHFLSLDENKYQEEVLQTMEVFIEKERKIRDITLEFLKEFPRYHKYAINYIEELEKNKTL